MRGGQKSTEQGPPINATSKDEENFIQSVPLSSGWLCGSFGWLTVYVLAREFMKNAEKEDQKAKH